MMTTVLCDKNGSNKLFVFLYFLSAFSVRNKIYEFIAFIAYFKCGTIIFMRMFIFEM